MQKKIVMLIALMVISVGFLSGCNETNEKEEGKTENGEIETSDEEKLVGTWEYSTASGFTDRRTFTSDGFMYTDEGKFDYWFENGYINTSITLDNITYSGFKFKYSFEGNDTLILEKESGDIRIYVRIS